MSIPPELNKLRKDIQRQIKPNECILCGKPITSCCNSHSVPRMVLKNIADNGKILQMAACLNLEFDIFDIEKGVNNSGTFFYICNECDSAYFKQYESETALLKAPNDTIMAQIALKNTLQQLSKHKYVSQLFEQAIPNKEYATFASMVQKIDIKEKEKDIIFYKDIINNPKRKKQFQLVCWYLLPYKVPIATQAMVAIIEDRQGKKLNDVYNYSPDNRMKNLHICVFPLKQKTAVFAFYHKRDSILHSLDNDFSKSSRAENLSYLNWLIFKYSENIFLFKTIREQIESDIRLSDLCKEVGDKFPNLGWASKQQLSEYRPVEQDEITNFLVQECQ